MSVAEPLVHPEPTVDFEMVLASLLDGVLAFDADQKVVYVNAAAEALIGHSRRELIGRHHSSVFPDAGWLAELVGRAFASVDASLRDEGKLGRDRPTQVLAVASHLIDPSGAREGIVLALHDLGRRHWLESEEQSRARLEEVDRMVASVAHELNNPLSGIRGAAQLLSRKLRDNPELANYGDLIVRQSDRMADLIRGLMRLEAPPPAFEPVNIHRVLNEVILLERASAESLGVRVQTEFDPSLPEVHGHGDQLQQLFLNLMKNAIRACPPKTGRVRVSTRMENSFYVETGTRRLRYIAVDVIDNGEGFDEETRRRLFMPFFSRSSGGHGLGLSIARNIAISHGGRIQADNAEEGGARFRVNLPVSERAPGEDRG
jgi:two-component system nitrogen regulation sensor histidine kinase GlnL